MSFYRDGILFKSTILACPHVACGFSVREGGVSTLPHTKAMNVADGHGDPPETVVRNIGILARAVSGGRMDENSVVCAPQIHSAHIRTVTEADQGSGTIRPAGESCDGFLTDCPGVLLMIRVADCVPILFAAQRADGAPVVCAVHAGWRGTIAGIAGEAVRLLLRAGAEKHSIRCAVGQAIHSCCYAVGDDFYATVAEARGTAFARAHTVRRGGQLYADIPGMNRTLLTEAGLQDGQIDVSPYCTACDPALFHSHRAGHGIRGAMGAMIGIIP